MKTDNSRLLVSAWKARNALYETLFGGFAYTLPKGNRPPVEPQPSLAGNPSAIGYMAADQLPLGLMAREQRMPVVVYAPDATRQSWLYVTNGLSNPWYQDSAQEVSGFGCELMVKSGHASRWAIKLLRRMAQYIVSYEGTLSPGVILNMKTPVAMRGGDDLNNIFVWYADEAPDCLYQLPTGAFGIFCTVGITEDECQFAESVDEYGCWCIQQVLRQAGLGQVTEPGRRCVMKADNIEDVLQSVRNYAQNFRPLA